jgi:arylsulfatase A-like enzyme
VEGVRRIARSAAILAALTLLPLAETVGPATPAAGQTGGDPNVLVIVTDDQRAMDTMEFMPKTMQWFGQGGTTFTNAYDTTPLCCPSRSAIMTGRFNHNNSVLDNGDQVKLDHNSTVQRYLRQHGYMTGMAGKFLNGWDVNDDPPNFDRWALMFPNSGVDGQRGYYGTTFNVDGAVAPVPQYSTDFIADQATTMIDDWNLPATDADPFYLFVTPYAPHGPWTAEGGHPSDDDDYRSTDVGTWAGNPGVFETDEGDKPTYVRNQDRTLAQGAANRQGQLRALLSVDDMVDDIFQELTATGEIDNTLALFISDNGFFWSEHGLTGKNAPYAESIRAPFLMRWPGHVAAAAVDDRIVANIDITPTLLAAAGIDPDPQFPLDGQSLLAPKARRKILTEAWPLGSRGPWASIRAPKYQYIEYYDDTSGARDFREYYNVTLDPYQLTNLIQDGNARNDPYLPPLEKELGSARTCVGSTCIQLLAKQPIPTRCPGAAGKPGQHLVGGDTRDRINGAAWRQVVCGRKGSDLLRGKGGQDRLLGGQKGDKLVGGPGRDILIGQGGRDSCIGGPGRDVFRGCEIERT